MTILRIEPTGVPAYSVDIRRGALSGLTTALEAHDGAVVLIADERVDRHWGDRAREMLAEADGAVLSLTFPAGENSKTRRTWARLTDKMVEAEVGRDGIVVGLGGGVTTDLAGFVAATYMRGIPWIAAPTTLLAMVDASIGGKTGVDHRFGKNLIGAFHHPRAVVADTSTLRTLDTDDIDCGLAEMVKHALISGQPDALDQLISQRQNFRAVDTDGLVDAISASVAVKAEVVSEDPLESGRRAVLNAGHTVAHALERTSDLTLPHGLAVAIGLVVEARISVALGLCREAVVETIVDALTSLGLPTRLATNRDHLALVEATILDKKNRAGRVRCSLLADIGEPARSEDGWTHEVPLDVLRSALEASV